MDHWRRADPASLLDKTYATTIDPRGYDEFMDAWDAFLVSADEGSEQVDLAKIESGPLHIHFNRALEILERVATKQRDEISADAIVAKHEGIGVVIDKDGRMIAASDDAVKQLSCNAGDHIVSTDLLPETIDRLMAWIGSGDSYLVLNGYTEASDTPLRLVAVSLETAQPQDTAQYFVSSTDLRLNDLVKSKLTETFSLSGAETDVAERLLDGQTPKEIAAGRSASINTIRSQIKSLLAKTDTRGIADLVRVLCAFVANTSTDLPVAPNAASSSPFSRHHVVRAKDGREIRVTDHGDPDGMPVLMFHSMLWGVELPQIFVDTCAQKNIRIIAPARPGYGGSDALDKLSAAEFVDAVADDAKSVLDHLNIDHVISMGHIVGSVYAQRFAVRYASACRGVLLVSHAPYWRDELLSKFPRRQRLVARTAKLAPAALNFVTRAGAALIESGGHDRFLSALHGDIPADARALRRPDVHAVLCAGIEFTTRAGTRGFCKDSQIGLTDWSRDGERVRAPIRILYGAEDQVITRDYIDGYVQTATQAHVSAIEDAGLHLLYSHWPRVLEELKAF